MQRSSEDKLGPLGLGRHNSQAVFKDQTVSFSRSQSMVSNSRTSHTFIVRKPSTLKKPMLPTNKPVTLKLSIITIAKIKRMAARAKKQYLARHPQLLQSQVLDIANTYQLGPTEQSRFVLSAATSILQFVVHFFFSDVSTYDPSLVNKLAKSTADDILRKCSNKLNCTRHKLISHVSVIERNGVEELTVTSRCVWDTQFDNSVTYTLTLQNLRVVATLFALYYN